MSDPVTRLNAALEGRYAIERELGEGGMATVYLADDLKHERKVGRDQDHGEPDSSAYPAALRFRRNRRLESERSELTVVVGFIEELRERVEN